MRSNSRPSRVRISYSLDNPLRQQDQTLIPANAKILHIEKLRALSIALVFLFHLEVAGFQNGFLGVDVFFVISGFLMAILYGDIASTEAIGKFFRRRMARILPAYYALVVCTAVFSFFFLLPHEIQMVMRQSLWAAFFLPNIGYWLDTSYFDHTNLRPLLNLWSLGVEVQFYLLFPFLLFIERRSSLLLKVLAIGSCAEYALLTNIDPESAFFLIPGRLWEFLAGVYAARFVTSVDTGTIPGHRYFGAVSVLLILAILLFTPSVARDYTFPATFAVVLLTAVAIVFGFSTGREQGLLSRSLVTLGQYSYSVYLVHFPVIVFVLYTPFGGTNLTPDGISSSLVAIAITAILSIVFYQLIEQKTRKALTGRQLLVTASVFCLLTVVIARPVVSLSQQIVDPKLWNLSNALNDKAAFRCAASSESALLAANSCRMGEDIADPQKRFLLVGDSHADAIKMPLADYLHSQQQTLRLMKENKAVQEDYPIALIIDEALAFEIDVIVAHSIDNEVRPDALEELALAAREEGITVAFIAPVPKYGFNVPARLLEDYRRNHELNIRASRLTDIDVSAEIAALDRRYENFHSFTTTQYYCESECFISNEAGNPYYFDSNHLTHTGAALLLPVFSAISTL